MLGIILVSIGTLFQEVSDSIGKNKITSREESPYTMAFLTIFWATIFFGLISIWNKDLFVFKSASLPTFSVRVIFEIIQLYVSVLAIAQADRTTFSFLRTLTIPLLLAVDLFLGYRLGLFGIVGVSVITLTTLLLFSRHEIKKKGSGLIIFSAINAVFTISLFKYNITHFNSVVAEQLISHAILLIAFFFIAFIRAKENPFVFLTKPIFLLQSASVGLGGMVESFAYNYGAASLIIAAKRSAAIFWSLLAGKQYFQEKNIVFKILITILLVLGLIFLSLN
jgi:hypothetical protein